MNESVTRKQCTAVNAYDAMSSDRPYRKSVALENVIAELRHCTGTQFDPELMEQFIQIIEQRGF